MKAVILGSGAWGTALALLLHKNGHSVTLWGHNYDKARDLEVSRESVTLPGIRLPAGIVSTSDGACLAGADLVVMAVPSFAVRATAEKLLTGLDPHTVVVSVAKGIEPGTCLRMSQVIEFAIGRPAAVLSGPSHAEEVSKGIPTGCVAACTLQETAEFVQDAFMNDKFRVYTSPDVIGVELGGALKNIFAICTGACDGMGYGDNTRALLMTRGMTELARMGIALGAKPETFSGLAGMGDLIVTCSSMHSRNRRAGIYMGEGMSPKDAMNKVGAVVEGYYAAKSAMELAEKIHADMPIIREAYAVLYRGKLAYKAVDELMQRNKKRETEDADWNAAPHPSTD